MIRQVAVAGILVLAVTAPAHGAPATQATAAVRADLDADGLDDDLDQQLATAGRDDRFTVIVALDPGADRVRLARDQRLTVGRDLPILNGFTTTVSPLQAQRLAAHPQVVRVQEDLEVRVSMDAVRRDVGVEAARRLHGVTGAGTAVCVLDTGVDPGHEQLDGKVPIPFHDAINGRTTAYDDHGHGTHVAAIAVGDGVGGTEAARFAGVAPAAALHAAKVLDGNGSGTESQIVAGVQWCADDPVVDVLSMSLGTVGASDGGDAISLAVNAASAAGKAVVVAAGNSGDMPMTVGSPGAATGAITVGAAAEWSAPPGSFNHSRGVYLAHFSSRGPTLDGRRKPDLVAPGVSVAAARVGTTNGYVAYSGTSMATPVVSGALALAREVAPHLTPTDLRHLLAATAHDRGAAGPDDDWGAGMLDVFQLVHEAAGDPTAVGDTALPTATRTSGVVADHGLWSWPVTLGEGDLGAPLAAAVTIDGQVVCAFPWTSGCLAWGWEGPDLDARLRAPDGTIVAVSECPLGCGDYSVGRQETVTTMPLVAGTYTIEVYPYEGSPNDGMGGTFAVDLSRGPVGEMHAVPTTSAHGVHVAGLEGVSTTRQGTRELTVRVDLATDTGPVEVPLALRGRWDDGTTSVCVTATSRCTIEHGTAPGRQPVTFTVTDITGMDGAAIQRDRGRDLDVGIVSFS